MTFSFECLEDKALVLALAGKRWVDGQIRGFKRRVRRHVMQGAWLICEVIALDLMITSAPLLEVLVQLANGGFPGAFLPRCHGLLRVDKMGQTDLESNVAVPPQLNKISKGADRIATITP
jgi:hypothetical protein